MRLTPQTLHLLATGLPPGAFLENAAAIGRLGRVVGQAQALDLPLPDVTLGQPLDLAALTTELSRVVRNERERCRYVRVTETSDERAIAVRIAELPPSRTPAYQRAYVQRRRAARLMLRLAEAGVAHNVQLPVPHGELGALITVLEARLPE
jgi:hypothetical protein